MIDFDFYFKMIEGTFQFDYWNQLALIFGKEKMIIQSNGFISQKPISI